MVGAGAQIAGSAARAGAGPQTHDTSGAIVGQGAQVGGAASLAQKAQATPGYASSKVRLPIWTENDHARLLEAQSPPESDKPADEAIAVEGRQALDAGAEMGRILARIADATAQVARFRQQLADVEAAGNAAAQRVEAAERQRIESFLQAEMEMLIAAEQERDEQDLMYVMAVLATA
jgi:hypothetical protein